HHAGADRRGAGPDDLVGHRLLRHRLGQLGHGGRAGRDPAGRHAGALHSVRAALRRPRGRPLMRAATLFRLLFGVLAVVFLIAPLVAILPLAFTSSVFLTYPIPGYSMRWF